VLNKSETVRIEVPVADVLVGASEIADVIPVSDRTLYMLGKRLGTTNVSLFDAAKKLVVVIDVVVTEDPVIAREASVAAREAVREREAAVEADIRQATGVSGLRVRAQGDRTALMGVAPDAVSVDRAMQVAPAGTINLTQVAQPQQVMLKVRFIEVNRSAARDLGFRFERSGRNIAARSGTIAGGAPLTTVGPPSIESQRGGAGVLTDLVPSVASAVTGVAPFAQILAHIGGKNSQLDVIISALEEKGLVRRLAEPNLVALSGGRAEFLAGGEIPIPTATTSVGGFPTITTLFREFGVKLGFTPTVLNNGVINLDLEPEVSNIDPSISVPTGGGIAVPGLIKRRARTSVQLRDGQSFAIAGLLQNQSTRTVEQVPWLGSIPIIGTLFSSKNFQESETELVVIVTPAIVKPAKPGQLLASPLDTTMPPNDLDYFASGKIEVRRNMREFVTKEGATVGPHGHLIPRVIGDQMDPR